jgi:hypothetical protein
MAPSRRGDDVFAAWWARTLRAASSPSSIQAVLEQAMRVDIRSVLPSVRTPTLVIHRRGDQVVDVEAGRFLAAGIPNAQLLVLPGEDHVWFINGLDIADAIVGFLGAPREPPEVDTWLATALFCGGPGGLLDAEKRALLDAGGARFVRVAPGGWVALFDSPTRAMRLADRLASLGRGRIGVLALHAGPCRVSDGEPAGHAFESGWRLLSKGVPGEVLVSATLRDILVGSARELVPRAVDAGDGDATASTVWLMRS